MAGERIGVLGGTYDPVHAGHLVVASESRHRLGLDRVLLVLAARPWQKEGERAITPPAHRLAMLRLAIDGVDGLEVSTVEIERDGPSYTVDTLEVLTAAHAGATLFLIVGADAAAGLPTWHDAGRIAGLATLAVVNRPGRADAEVPLGWPHEHVTIPELAISSTDVRARVAAGRPIDGLVPAAVVRYIREHGLYAAPR